MARSRLDLAFFLNRLISRQWSSGKLLPNPEQYEANRRKGSVAKGKSGPNRAFGNNLLLEILAKFRKNGDTVFPWTLVIPIFRLEQTETVYSPLSQDVLRE